MKKRLWIGITILLFTTGCQPTEPTEPTEPVSTEQETVISEEAPGGFSPDLMEKWEQVLEQQENSAAAIGLFIREHGAEASAQEMEMMIEKLVLHQAGLKNRFHQKIYSQAYMEALNQTMGGKLTPEKIVDIEEEEVKRDYQELVDAYLTVVRYGDTPAVETDWEALKQYEEAVTQRFSRWIILKDKMQNHRYGRQDTNYEEIIQDMIETEKMIQSKEVSFLTWQLKQLYNRQIAALFVGPEGSYMETFIHQDNELYQLLVNNASAYPDSGFAKLVQSLEEAEATDSMTLYEIIENVHIFGVNGSAQIVKEPIEGGESLGDLRYLHFPQDQEKEKAVNHLINEIASSMDLPEEAIMANSFYFMNDHFLSFSISATYTTEEGAYQFKEEFVTIDLEGLERENLKNMLEGEGVTVALSDIVDTAPEDIDQFVIGGSGLHLKWQEEEQENDTYKRLWFSELEKHMSLDKLFQ
ncbi:hypothetical protein [Tindallia californiensis]|uniref:Uncharacterized protein n=1 Tax=Tindallia californiensis TaxID=159292 RepID=A0A1H3QSH6_9FIRM|nr:hypothetical protein [Tindallia californiensis]SDZ15955.1 hypothetical protein SAMN05192546_11072 [Tindallia californiensis]